MLVYKSTLPTNAIANSWCQLTMAGEVNVKLKLRIDRLLGSHIYYESLIVHLIVCKMVDIVN